MNMLSENTATFALFDSADADYMKANIDGIHSCNLTDVYSKKFNNPSIINYCVIATEDFVEKNPKAITQLLKDIEASVKKSSDL